MLKIELTIIGGLAFMIAAIGDVTAAALVAGVFSLINTVLNITILRRSSRIESGQRGIHRAITAPRRAIYDADGRIIGTVMALDTAHDPRLEQTEMPH